MKEYNGYQGYPPMDQDLESAKLLSPQSTAPSIHSAYINKGTETVLVKTKLKRRYRQFEVPTNFTHSQMIGALKEQMDMVDKMGAHVGTAYLLWLLFGFFGIHRFYLKQHSGASWAIWFFTGQLFGIGWLIDGIFLAHNVKQLNRRMLYDKMPESQSGFMRFLFGFKTDSSPSKAVAYVLWFFFGFLGIHRWYTGYHTPSSFTAWLVTLQMFGFGWLYDLYYIDFMIDHPRVAGDNVPFYIKVQEKYDYVPVSSDDVLASALNAAYIRPEKSLRVLIVEKKRDDIAYLSWLFFGILGAHAWYLDMGSLYIRFLTGNFFVFGYIFDGIRLQDEIARANLRVAGDFVPSLEGGKVWPHLTLGVIGVSESA